LLQGKRVAVLNEMGYISFSEVFRFGRNMIEAKANRLTDSVFGIWVYNPMTMREIKKMIAEVVDYDTYIDMDLEDTGHAKINGKWVYVG